MADTSCDGPGALRGEPAHGVSSWHWVHRTMTHQVRNEARTASSATAVEVPPFAPQPFGPPSPSPRRVVRTAPTDNPGSAPPPGRRWEGTHVHHRAGDLLFPGRRDPSGPETSGPSQVSAWLRRRPRDELLHSVRRAASHPYAPDAVPDRRARRLTTALIRTGAAIAPAPPRPDVTNPERTLTISTSAPQHRHVSMDVERGGTPWNA
jgi:hypothetical protein